MNLLFEIIVFFFPLIICTSQSMLSNKDNTLLSPHMTNHDPTIPAPYYGWRPWLFYFETDLSSAIDIVNLPEGIRQLHDYYQQRSATDERDHDEKFVEMLINLPTLWGFYGAPEWQKMFKSTTEEYNKYLALCNIKYHRRLKQSRTIPRILRVYFFNNECRENMLPIIRAFIGAQRNRCTNFTDIQQSEENYTGEKENLEEYCRKYNGARLQALLPEQYKSLNSDITKHGKQAKMLQNKQKYLLAGGQKTVEKFVRKFEFQPLPLRKLGFENYADEKSRISMEKIKKELIKIRMPKCTTAEMKKEDFLMQIMTGGRD